MKLILQGYFTIIQTSRDKCIKFILPKHLPLSSIVFTIPLVNKNKIKILEASMTRKVKMIMKCLLRNRFFFMVLLRRFVVVKTFPKLRQSTSNILDTTSSTGKEVDYVFRITIKLSIPNIIGITVLSLFIWSSMLISDLRFIMRCSMLMTHCCFFWPRQMQ